MKVLFLTNVPSPYRVDFFNELGKHCDLTVLFEKCTSDERDSSWEQYRFENFIGCILRGKKVGVDNAVCFDVIKYLKKGAYDHIIVSDFLDPTGMIAIEYMRIKRIPYWLESDGGIAKDGKGFAEGVKRYFIRGAKGYFSTSKLHDEYYLQYGAEVIKLFRYPFTSIKKSEIPAQIPSSQEKSMLKRRLGLTEQFTVLSVGRFSYLNGYGKGYDVLMKVAEQLQDVQFCIVGEEPTKEFVDWKREKKLNNVIFVGFKDRKALGEFYLASDLFVLMTVADVWGLVINEAMMYGLPVITTDKCVAGVELVRNNENGYIVPVGAEQVLMQKLEWIVAHPDVALRFGKCSKMKIQDYTIESMSSAHMRVLGESKNEGVDQRR